jgi:hypothetical protein
MTIIQKMKECAARGISYPFNYAWSMCLYHYATKRQPVSGLRYFCQNAGGCGSMYVVELLKANGLERCYHQKRPELDALGIDFYEGKASAERLQQVLIHTRKDVFFEACNRLFSMSRVLKKAFPDARFIHLHRDPREVIPSALTKPASMTWNSGRRRYTSEPLCGSASASVLERSCRYWTNYNQRILDDLQGEDCLSLKFSDLIAGNVEALEAFMDVKLPNRIIEPVNANKPVGKQGRYPAFEQWTQEDQELLYRFCGPVMEVLGYELQPGDG